MGPILGGMPRASWAADKYALTITGNSIMAYPNTSVQDFLYANPLISSHPGFSITNKALVGKTIEQMIGSAAEVLEGYRPGKVNFLFPYETDNSLSYGDTPQQVIDALTECIAQYQFELRRAYPNERPWVVLLPTAIPHNLGSMDREDKMRLVNGQLRANYRTMGARALVEMRKPGSVFDDPSSAAITGPNFYWTRDGVHPNDTGSKLIADIMCEQFRLAPAR